MNETWLRWKARIGSLKAAAVLIIIFAAILGVAVAQNLVRVLKNPQGTQVTPISQLATNQVEKDRFVTVSGLAAYELGYQETEDGRLKAIFYPLIDQNSGYLVFVRTTRTELADAPDASVTLSGMTQSAPSDLQQLIIQDMADINAAGFATIESLYIEEGREPGDLIVYLLQGAGLALLLLVCAATFVFPGTVFKPYPLQQVVPGTDSGGGIKATGSFQQLKQVQPTMEFGRTRRKFQNAAANLFTIEDKWIGVYIHFIYTYRVYGVQVSKQESDWAVMIKPTQIVALEPGKLYGWKDRWAVSFRYRDEADKEQTLFVIFDNLAAQVSFVSYLREKGYPVSSGLYAVTGTQAWA